MTNSRNKNQKKVPDKGRAYIGYSEAMAAMGDEAEHVVVRPFSYGSEKNIPLFYTDMVGINPMITEDKKALAFELANLLISEEVLTGVSRPAKDGGSPQYLLTARRSMYDTLCQDYPIYSRLKAIVDSTENRVFRLGEKARQYIPDMEAALSERMLRLIQP